MEKLTKQELKNLLDEYQIKECLEGLEAYWDIMSGIERPQFSSFKETYVEYERFGDPRLISGMDKRLRTFIVGLNLN